jgi:hypothetical protein
LQEWTGPTLELTRVVQLEPGFAHSLHRLTNKHMLVISVPFDGIPAFTILDQQLQASSINIRWHNPMNPKDVDDDQTISPLDVLRIIDQINKYGARQIENVGEIFCDVDDDGSISPLDVLFLIDWLNSKSGGQGEGESNRANQESVVESLFAGEIDWFSHSVSDEFGQCQIGRIKRPGRSSNR